LNSHQNCLGLDLESSLMEYFFNARENVNGIYRNAGYWKKVIPIMTNESEKKLLKLIKHEVFSTEITDAINDVLETISIQRKQKIQPSPFQRPKSLKRWTKEEEKNLIESFLAGTTLDKIAIEHERSCNAIFQRLLLTGIVSLNETINFNKPHIPISGVTETLPKIKETLPGRICIACGERINPLRLSKGVFRVKQISKKVQALACIKTFLNPSFRHFY
jgi:hypothetical protein